MTPKQLNFVNKLIAREGLSFASADFALEFSKNRTQELTLLTHQETQALIAYFTTPSPSQRMKRKILSMAHEMRWETKAGKVDMDRLNAWCNKYTPTHCNFNSITVADLPIVVSVFEKMYKSFLKQL